MTAAVVALLLVSNAPSLEVAVPGPAGNLGGCGIATLRLDDRGVGASAGDANAATAEDTAADAHAALRFLRAHSDIDPRRIGLIGHSYGGEVAPMVAAADPAVAALVLLAGPARPFRETMRYQHRYRIDNDPAIAAADRAAALAEAMRQQEANVAASTEAWRRSIQDRPGRSARRVRPASHAGTGARGLGRALLLAAWRAAIT